MDVIQNRTFSRGQNPSRIYQGVLVRFFRSIAGLLLVSALVACGGETDGETQESGAQRNVAGSAADTGTDLTRGRATGLDAPSYGTPLEGVDRALMTKRLAQRFNGRFASQPEALMGDRQRYADAKAFQPVVKAYGGTPTSVHRFLNIRTGAHFYTMSEEEKTSVQRNLPQFRYEGQAFFALNSSDVPLSPVYRFYSIYTGTHFYTIDPEERDYVRTYYWMYFNYEGVSWYATSFAGPGWTPMHRFFNNAAGTHFYTADEAERLNVIATLPHMEYEGIGYYVRTSGAALPVSPVSRSDGGRDCISPDGSDEYRPCETAEQMPPRAHVDGNRAVPNGTPRFAQVQGRPETDCKLDRTTGLVWEIKTDDGLRSSSREFLHIDRADRPQVVVETEEFFPHNTIHVPRVPTQAEIMSPDTSRAYVDYINSIQLCGYSDWRIPTASELVNVLTVQGGYFPLPLRGVGPYISSDSATWDYDVTYNSGDVVRYRVDGVVTVRAREGWLASNPYATGHYVDFDFRAKERLGYVAPHHNHLYLHLVRGAAAPTASRYSAVTIPYGRDAASNVLVDNWSKLQWRRCAEGQSWTGTTCIGQPLSLNLYDALSRAAALPGWRLPGIKELDSLYVRDPDTTKVQMDFSAFPMNGFAPGALPFWSMTIDWQPIFDTEHQKSGLSGFQASFEGTPAGSPTANVRQVSRYRSGYVRLVRVHP